MTFKENGYEVVRNVVSEQLLKNLSIEFKLLRDNNFFSI